MDKIKQKLKGAFKGEDEDGSSFDRELEEEPVHIAGGRAGGEVSFSEESGEETRRKLRFADEPTDQPVERKERRPRFADDDDGGGAGGK